MIEKISFPSGGETMRGTLFTPDKMEHNNPGVLLFHGTTSSEAGYLPIAERLADLGIVGMTLNVRGHGSSGGDFDKLTPADAMEDGINAYDFFAKYAFLDISRIGAVGGSLGGAVASIVAEHRAIKSLALRAPATYTDEMLRMKYKDLMVQEGQIFHNITNVTDTPAIRAISKFTGSLLVIRSENDTIIPVEISTGFLLNAKHASIRDEVEIPGAPHNITDPDLRKKFVNEVVNWFVETL